MDLKEPDEDLGSQLPGVGSTPCFVVLDSQVDEPAAPDDGQGSSGENRANRLRQLAELSKDVQQPAQGTTEMETSQMLSRTTQSEGRVRTTGTAELDKATEVDTMPGKPQEASAAGRGQTAEEEEEEQVGSTQEDLFNPDNPSLQQEGNSPADVTSKDASRLICTPSESLGILHLSGAVLANETSTSGSSASVNIILLSPEAYDPVSLMVPSTPPQSESHGEPMDMSETEGPVLAALPKPMLKRKSTTSEDSEDVYKVPAWQEELNRQQVRAEAAAASQDSWLLPDDHGPSSLGLSPGAGPAVQTLVDPSADSANPSSSLSENTAKSSLDSVPSMSVPQQQPLMSTTDESSKQSALAGSRPPSTTMFKEGANIERSHSVPVREAPYDISTARSSSQAECQQKDQAPEGHGHKAGEVESADQPRSDRLRPRAEMTDEADVRQQVEMSEKEGEELGGGDSQVEMIEIQEEGGRLDDGKEAEGAEGGGGEEGAPSQEWNLHLSPSQTQTQTQGQYSIAHRQHVTRDILPQSSQAHTQDGQQQLPKRPTPEQEKGDGSEADQGKDTAGGVAPLRLTAGDRGVLTRRKSTPWHSTPEMEEEEGDHDDSEDDEKAAVEGEVVAMVISGSEEPVEGVKAGESHGLGASDKSLDSSRGGQGGEDSVFLEGLEEQWTGAGGMQRGEQLESDLVDTASPIAGFHLSMPKDGALLRPIMRMTPGLPGSGKRGDRQPDRTPRHSTPIYDESEQEHARMQRELTQPRCTVTAAESKTAKTLVVDEVMDLDSAENSELPQFNLENPAIREGFLEMDSPSKRKVSVFSRIREATEAAKTKVRKQSQGPDKDPFTFSESFVLGKGRKKHAVVETDGKADKEMEGAMGADDDEGNDEETIEIQMEVDEEEKEEEEQEERGEELKKKKEEEEKSDAVETISDQDITTSEKDKIHFSELGDEQTKKSLKRRKAKKGSKIDLEYEVLEEEMSILAQFLHSEGACSSSSGKDERGSDIAEPRESRASRGSTSKRTRAREGESVEHMQEETGRTQRRDPYDFTESQSNKTPTPMKTWTRADHSLQPEDLPIRNLTEEPAQPLNTSATKQPSNSAVTPRRKRPAGTKSTTSQQKSPSAVTPRGKKSADAKTRRQTRSAKRKRPPKPATTEEDTETELTAVRLPALPRKSPASGRRGREAQRRRRQSPGRAHAAASARGKGHPSPRGASSLRSPPTAAAAAAAAIAGAGSLQDDAADQTQAVQPSQQPNQTTTRQSPHPRGPSREPTPWKVVRYKKVTVVQRVKEVIEWGEVVETTVLEEDKYEQIEKLEQEYVTSSPQSKTSSLTSGYLGDISSLGSRISSSSSTHAASLQKSASLLSAASMHKSISLSNISEADSSLPKTISLPGSEKSSPCNVSVSPASGGTLHRETPVGGMGGSPEGVQRIPSTGAAHVPTNTPPGNVPQVGMSSPKPSSLQRRQSRRSSHVPEQHASIGGFSSPEAVVSPPGVGSGTQIRRGKRAGSKGSSSSSADGEREKDLGEKDGEFTRPQRTPSKRVQVRTPEQMDQTKPAGLEKWRSVPTGDAGSSKSDDEIVFTRRATKETRVSFSPSAPPSLNAWDDRSPRVGLGQSSEESEGIPCAQPTPTASGRVSSEAVEMSDVEDARQQPGAGEGVVAPNEAEPSGKVWAEPVGRTTRGQRRGKARPPSQADQTLEDTQLLPHEGEGVDEEGEVGSPSFDPETILRSPPRRQGSSSTSEHTSDSARPFLQPGVRVFTRWYDGFFYPGTIKSEEKWNRLKVDFDDGSVRTVSTKDVVIKDWLSCGQSVMAESPDGYSYPGIVIGYYRDASPSKCGYVIETDRGETARYPRAKVILSRDQAALLLTSCTSSSTGVSDISLDNLVEGPRQRSRLRTPKAAGGVTRTPSKLLGRGASPQASRTPTTPTTTTPARKSASPALTRAGGKRKMETPTTAGSGQDVVKEAGLSSPRKRAKHLAPPGLATATASPDLSKQGALRRSPRKQPAPPPAVTSPTRSPRKTPSTPTGGLGAHPSPRRALLLPPTKTTELMLGPLPSNRTLFRGLAFLLTQSEVRRRPLRAVADSSTSESEAEGEESEDIPFDKDYARKQIEAGGGVVLKDFQKSQRVGHKTYLIANTYCRTKKYFLALAVSMPCISHLWLRDCCRSGKQQSHKAYLLPAGEGLGNEIVEWKANRSILSGLKVFVMSVHYEVEATWRAILIAAGCNVVAKFPTINELTRGGVPFDCNVVVTDPTCPRHVLHRAQQLAIPVVSVEWVMQCLISGNRLPYQAHQKFAWDFKEKVTR